MSELVEVGFVPNEKTYPLDTATGAWIKLRRLKGGERTERIDAALAYIPSPTGKEDGEAHINQTKLRAYDFSKAIIDHNMAVDGKKLSFSNADDVASLDGDVSDEINDLIDEHNVSLGEDQVRFPGGASGPAVSGLPSGEGGATSHEQATG